MSIDDTLARTAQERYRLNIEAIKVLKSLDGRLPDTIERERLVKYSGWGSLSEVFDGSTVRWQQQYQELKDFLTVEEYVAARASTLNAFYTPRAIVETIYKVLENAGFKDGHVLEPSCGTGTFIGMLPPSLSGCSVHGIELDPLTGRIAQLLYPQSRIDIKGFEETDFDSPFDVAVGNVPFGNYAVYGVSDKHYDKEHFLIHDYFFAKALDAVRSGGVVAFVTSKGTLDKKDSSTRRYLAKRAELVGAVRLPNDAFLASAGTEVTCDIVFLQKRESESEVVPDWVYLATDTNGVTYNRHFVEHPECVLGQMRLLAGRFGDEAQCVAEDDAVALEERLQKVVQHIGFSISRVSSVGIDTDREEHAREAQPGDLKYAYKAEAGELFYRKGGYWRRQDVGEAAYGRIVGLLSIRDSVRKLIGLQTDDATGREIAAAQQELSSRYDAFVKVFGRVCDRRNSLAFRDDSSYPLLRSLEHYDDAGSFIGKADLFTRRTIRAAKPVVTVETAADALAVSLDQVGCVDLDYMAELARITRIQVIDELQGVIFMDPKRYVDSGSEVWLTAEEYLSGNIYEKIEAARKDSRFAGNVSALLEVMPKPLEAAEIDVRLGTTWIGQEYIQEFVYDLLETGYFERKEIKVRFAEYTSAWFVEGKSADYENPLVYSTYGTARVNAYKIIEESLNLKTVSVYDMTQDAEGKDVRSLNTKETALARSKQGLIEAKFRDWVFANQRRREILVARYNELFNAHRQRTYDGSHLIFPGMNAGIELKKHQKDAVARVIYGGNTLLAHVVGAGKTYEMVAAAQEMKRLGLCSKSLIVVPKHLVEQWAHEYLTLYPGADILVASERDFERDRRREFCSRIATGDYDAVIIGQTQFERIPMSAQAQKGYLDEQLGDILACIEEQRYLEGGRFTVKELEAAKKRILLKLHKLNNQSIKDDVITFEELGVDRLFIDESHFYKNLGIQTKMKAVAGVSTTDAQKTADLFMKCRYMDKKTGGRGVVFATGTPVANSMCELYSLQRYLQYDHLHEMGLGNFDAWASTFGDTETAMELDPTGKSYRAKTRFAKFYNLPELMTHIRLFADIQTAESLNLPVPVAEIINVSVKPTEFQREIVDSLVERAKAVRSGSIDPTVDNMLKITNDGRKLALDQRLIDPALPDSGQGKVEACADCVSRIWEETREQKLTQLVFCDLSTPKATEFNVYDKLRQKLIENGVKNSQIAFIHDYKDDKKRDVLFRQVREGRIRVLIGSTQKMGAGTNVQDRLIAIHDLECPWRPSDLEQRRGRIQRQGNKNAKVEIYRYVTEETFDAYLYQLVESKQRFISQIMTSKVPVRAVSDIDEAVLDYATIKALATGNPLIRERMDLELDVTRLKLLKSGWKSQNYQLQDMVSNVYPQQLARHKELSEGYAKDEERVGRFKRENGDDFKIVLDGETFEERKQAGLRLLELCGQSTSPRPTVIGSYQGFDLQIQYLAETMSYQALLVGAITHRVNLGDDPVGATTRLDNALKSLSQKSCEYSEKAKLGAARLNSARSELKKSFPDEDELDRKAARLNELETLLENGDLVDVANRREGKSLSFAALSTQAKRLSSSGELVGTGVGRSVEHGL